MSPASFFAPDFAKVVGHGIVSRFVEGFLRAFSKFIVTLGDLPDCIVLVW